MNGKYLLDTNIVIALFAKEPNVQTQLNNAKEVSISVITIGELVFGAHKSKQVGENLSRIQRLVEKNVILGCNSETAYHYGHLKHWLGQRGQPIPENDIWIAALAQQYELTLVSRDKHFGMVEGLNLEVW